MRHKILKKIDWSILISSVILLVIGMVALFSATKNADHDEFQKQLMWFLVSIPIIALVIAVDYKIFAKLSIFMYIAINSLLVIVLFTTSINGASSWFNIGGYSFQPSEFAKIVLILFLPYIIVKLQRKGKTEINKLWKLGVCLILISIPIVLILLQPDYGTAMAFLVAIIAILFVAGINKKYIIASALVVIVAMPLLYFFVLPEHAKTRIDVYFNPYEDPRGSGYNIIQSRLAIGAGEMFGMGILKGNQTQLGYLYPKSTDFIYAVIGEEMGFVMAATIIIVYTFLITRAVKVAKNAKDNLGAYIATGIAGILIFHMTQNIGMTMGLLPITGVPLLFISYGGSSLMTSFILIGLLLNISGRKGM